MALSQTQPEGLGRIFRSTALPLTYVERLHRAHDALLSKKCGSSRREFETSTDPSLLRPFYIKMLKFFVLISVLAIRLNKASVKTRFKDFLKSWGVYIALFFVFYFAMQAFQSRNAPKSGPAPDINAFDVNNEPVNLQNYQGQATLIYFWATWCNICSLTRDSIYNISTDHPVITIANQSGDNEQIYAYQKKHQFNVTVINDEEGLISQTYGVYGLPTMFILDKNGEISDVEIGLSSEWGLRVRLWWASL